MPLDIAVEKCDSARQCASVWLFYQVPGWVAAAIQKAMEKRETEIDFKAEDVLRELAKIGFANMMDYTRVTDEGDLVVDLSSVGCM